MPTARHRYQVTETDDVLRALESAQRRWPGESRSRLIVRLITENGAAVDGELRRQARERERAVAEVAGSFSGLYPAGDRDELRNEWPE